MASQRFILIVNNIVIRDYDNSPVFEVQEGGRKFYSNGKGNNELERRVEEVTNQILTEELNNPLNEVIEQASLLTRYNNDFKLKMFVTPLYELQMQLAEKPGALRLAGSSVDIGALWMEQQEEFYQKEFLKYTQLIDYLETAVRKVRHKNSPYTIKHGEHQVMVLAHLKVNGLFNPLTTAMKNYEGTNIYKQLFDEEPPETTSLDDPAVFRVDVMKGTVPCYFSTSTDLLALCSVKEKAILKSRDLYRLMAGIIIKEIYPPDFGSGKAFQGALHFPIEQVLYQIVDAGGNIVSFYEDEMDASRFAMSEGMRVIPLDPIENFMETAFPDERRTAIEKEEIIEQIRGAYFV